MAAMPAWRARRVRLVVAVLLMLSLIASTTAIVLAVTSNQGPFTGCLAIKTNKNAPAQKGQLYNVKVGDTPLSACLAGDPQVSFSNMTGPQGEQGPPGVLGFYVREVTENIPAGALGGARAVCDEGDQATGGGYRVSQSANPPHITEALQAVVGSPPSPTGPPLGWRVLWENRSSFDGFLTAHAVCADLTP